MKAVRLETFRAAGETQQTPTLPGSAGGGLRPGAEEDEAEGRPLLCADFAHRGRPEAAAAHRAEHLCARRPGAHRPGQESAEYGAFPFAQGAVPAGRRLRSLQAAVFGTEPGSTALSALSPVCTQCSVTCAPHWP